MSGKPLDCVGVDANRADLGKSDFIPCRERPILYGEGKPPVAGEPDLAEARDGRRAPKTSNTGEPA